jgi:hypothetical protein
MSTLNTNGTFKERLPYIIMSILFTVGVVFCIINTYEFGSLLNNDPDNTLEVSHNYTWFLIVCNAFFAFLFLLLLIMSAYLAVNPRGNNWATNLLKKMKVFIDTNYYADIRKQQQDILSNFESSITFETAQLSSERTLRGPKITYSCPKDKETVIPVLNEPIKRITFGDFEPYDTKKAKAFEKISAPTIVQPLTLNSLKDLYLSKKNRV